MIGALILLGVGFAFAGALALLGHRHNRAYDSRRAER